MKCFIIAQVVDSYNKVMGYKLFDSDAGDTMVVDLNQIKTVLTKQPELIQNARLVNGMLSGTNGKLDRYPRVNKNGALVSGDKSPLVVLNKIDNVGYTVVDFKGQTARISNEKAVEYAKEHGIANGKVVTQDSIEFISSISGEYDTVKLAPSKAGANTRVNIPIRIGGDAASVAKHTAEDIQTEMEYNDVFQAMSMEQRSVLKQYYTWYTVDAYQKMAKNVRLNLAPGKAEKLAQLRGTDKWEFAGINDSYMEGNFKAHCELGHRLRYEYFAIPEGVLDENHSVKTYDRINYRRAKRDTVQELREAGAIVFGEQCAGDFFNISPEDMKKLVKIRTTMSDEISLMSNILTNHLEESYKSKCKLLYQVIAKLGNTENVIKAFGDNVGYTLLAFMKAAMPFPMSLVILAADQARKDKETFYTTVFPEYKDIIKVMLNAGKDTINSPNALAAGGCLLEFIAEYTLEGDYQYDPTTDEQGIRKDIGRYNKDTRAKRDAEVTSFILNTSVNVKILKDIQVLLNYFKAFSFYYKVAGAAQLVYANTSVLNTEYNKINKLAKMLGNDATSNTTREADKEKYDIDYDDVAIAMFISSVSFMKNETESFYPYREYGKYFSYCRNGVFETIKTTSYTYSTFRRVEMWKNIEAIAAGIDELVNAGETPKSIVEKALNPIIAKKEKLLEEEKTKPRYVKFDLTLETKDSKYDVDYYAVAKLDYITFKEIEKASLNNNTTYGVNTNETGDKSILLHVGEYKNMYEITESDYNYYIDNIDRNRERHQVQLEIAERNKKAEEERILALAEKQRKEAEEAAKREMENEAKLDKLKKLISEYSGDKREYGIQTAQAILEQGVVYSKLSPKQRWRIDKTLKDLENQSNVVTYDLAGFNPTAQAEQTQKDKAQEAKDKAPETEDKAQDAKATNLNEENLKALNDKEAEDAIRLLLGNVNIKTEQDNNIAFSAKVALTLNNTGKMSDKQKTYLMKGYEKLKERLKK